MASDDLRARIAEALAGHEPVPGMWDCTCGARTYDFAQHRANAVLAVVQPELDRERSERDEALERSGRLLERSIEKTVARKKAEAERDRYRLAWQSARHRAQAYGEGILRHVADREQWKSWAGKQEARAQKAEAALAEYEHVRASVTAGKPLGRALTVSEVLEQHEVTRKELIHELDQGLHLNWRQVIAAAGRMRRAAFDWMKDCEQARAERDAALEKLTARSDRCPQCRCDDCNGLLAQHTDTGCSCDECVAYLEYACHAFALSERITLISQQLGPLLSVHLGEKQQRRCLAVAHAAHHALHAYDYPEETER